MKWLNLMKTNYYETFSISAVLAHIRNTENINFIEINVHSGEILYVYRTEGNFALATYFAGNGYKTAWFTAKYLKII